MKKSAVVSGVLAALMVAGIGGTAQAVGGDGICDSNEFCAFSLSGFSTLLLESTAVAGTKKVDVVDNAVSSYKNQTGNCWRGVTVRTGLPDQTLLNANPNTSQSIPSSSWDNKIDHFDVKAGTC